jgi:DNA-binding LytR/AlgR family response regulator
VNDIVCLVAQKDYTQITLLDGNKLVTKSTLSSFEQQLPPGLFVRIQRSYLVSLKHVKSYNSTSVILTTGEQAPIGRTFREAFVKGLAAIR